MNAEQAENSRYVLALRRMEMLSRRCGDLLAESLYRYPKISREVSELFTAYFNMLAEAEDEINEFCNEVLAVEEPAPPTASPPPDTRTP